MSSNPTTDLDSNPDPLSVPPVQKLRVAVTGGSGRIGRPLCRLLIARGHEVINLDRRKPSEALGKFVYCDLRQREVVQRALEQVDAVCHLGEIPHVGNQPPEEVFATNTAIGSTVLQTAADLQLKRIIYTSTCQTYGQWEFPRVPPVSLPYDETAPLRPQNAYAASKVANESYARALSGQMPDLSIAIFRMPWVISEDVGLDQLQWYTHAPKRHVDGLGTYLHVTDAVRGYVMAVEKPIPGCEAYHLTAAKVRITRPLAELIRELHPDYPPLPTDWPANKSPLLLDKMRSHFGWVPLWDILEVLKHLGAPGNAPPPRLSRTLTN